MNSASDVISKLMHHGVTVKADGEELVLAPASKVPHDLIPTLQRLKPAILALLSKGSEPSNPTVAGITTGFDEQQRRSFWKRQVALQYIEGFDRWTAELLAVGELPSEVKRWPAKHRAELAALVQSGCSRCEAEGRLRIEYRLTVAN